MNARRLAQLMLVIEDFGRVWPTPSARINPGRVTSMLKLYTDATRPKFGIGDVTHYTERVVDSEDMFFTAFELY